LYKCKVMDFSAKIFLKIISILRYLSGLIFIKINNFENILALKCPIFTVRGFAMWYL